MAKILVTGGMGFIGSHIVDACVARKDEVFLVDDLSSGKKENANPKAPNFEIDIFDAEKLEKVFQEIRPEIIFHCAALARIQPSFENPDRYFQVNAIGTRNILRFAKKYKTRRVVYSASSSAYGDQDAPALYEGMKITSQSLHPYGSTKRMGEMLMRDMGKATGGPETVCLRYFNVYGPRQTTTADGPYATVIGIFLDQAQRGEPLTIVPDGDQRRDFTWVGDVVKANLLAAESSKAGGGEIINIGSGENHSIWGVASLVLGRNENTDNEELLKSGKCVMAPPRRGEVRQTLADISLAYELLGWRPEVSFKEGIDLLKSGLNNKI
ncbi:MAG: NAD-dependent epimerase/dehydratase family protein [Candidatus Niyogibacteria bacterium]|nr:MAG: NAD-dependent epimerase/dehydratase family protein [Candidatus Niyogibacteria bacterium]